MGGGSLGGRTSYAARRYSSARGKSLKDYQSGGKPRAFISFHVEDEAQVELLRQQAKDPRFNLEFIDSSIKEPFDEKWKTQCTPKIEGSDILVVMIGPETYKREAVLWEIEKAYELGKPVIGVRIYKDQDHPIPKPLIDRNAKIMNWDLDEIQKEIDKARAEKG